ncbi:MAG: glycosyltransferase family 9 protein [Planctomycetaceae bacterium]
MIRFRKRPPLSSLTPRRVCLIKPSALGDIVQTLPVLSALRRLWPEAHIAWVVKNCFADLLTDHPELDEVIGFTPRTMSGMFLRETRHLWRALREDPFDVAIDLQGLLRSGYMAWASGAPRRIGFSCGREGSTWCYTDQLEVPPTDMPVMQRYWKVVRAFGGSNDIPPAQLGVLPEHRLWAARQILSRDQPLLAIHPGAGWQTKRWPARHFLRIAQLAAEHHDATILLIGGPDCRAAADEIVAGFGGPIIDLCGRTTLRQLAALCEQADVVLSGDSGPMHLAAAVGTRVVSIFTCTNTIRHAPHGQEESVIASQVACAASHRKLCSHMLCMDELTPFRVWPKLSAELQNVVEQRTVPQLVPLRACA